MQCAVINKKGEVENVIMADPTKDTYPDCELVEVDPLRFVTVGWVYKGKKFRPGPDVPIPVKTLKRSNTEIELSFDFEGGEMSPHSHGTIHYFKVEKGSFWLKVGNVVYDRLTPNDGEVELPANVSHTFKSLEDDSVAVNRFITNLIG